MEIGSSGERFFNKQQFYLFQVYLHQTYDESLMHMLYLRGVVPFMKTKISSFQTISMPLCLRDKICVGRC